MFNVRQSATPPYLLHWLPVEQRIIYGTNQAGQCLTSDRVQQRQWPLRLATACKIFDHQVLCSCLNLRGQPFSPELASFDICCQEITSLTSLCWPSSSDRGTNCYAQTRKMIATLEELLHRTAMENENPANCGKAKKNQQP